MSKLVIHPRDDSTRFLEPIYQGDEVTVVQGGFDYRGVSNLIERHDQILMMGHGSKFGLLSVGQFKGGFVIHGNHTELLAEKRDSVFIWCNADQYVEHHKLPGFYTGMFISEIWEAGWMGVHATQDDVEESNWFFAEVVNSSDSAEGMYDSAMDQYGYLTRYNPVAAYNHQRFYLRTRRTIKPVSASKTARRIRDMGLS